MSTTHVIAPNTTPKIVNHTNSAINNHTNNGMTAGMNSATAGHANSNHATANHLNAAAGGHTNSAAAHDAVVARKSIARVALFDLAPASTALLGECFRQFGVETLQIHRQQADRLHKEKFEACVLPLDPTAGQIIELARASASNSRMVIYGLGGTAKDALRYSKLCLNAVFHEPLERSAALKLVRSSRTLIQHEFQRYVRVPVMTEVKLVMADGSRVVATSQEISCGGMSLRSAHPPEPGMQVEVSFALLTLPRVWIRGAVAWKKPNKSFGIRFDASDERRQRLKEWLVAFLES